MVSLLRVHLRMACITYVLGMSFPCVSERIRLQMFHMKLDARSDDAMIVPEGYNCVPLGSFTSSAHASPLAHAHCGHCTL